MSAQPKKKSEAALEHHLPWLTQQPWYQGRGSYEGRRPTDPEDAERALVLQTNRPLTADEEREVRKRFGDVPVKFLHTGPTRSMVL